MGDAAIDDGDCNWYATDVGPCPKVFIFIFLSLRLLYPLIARADLLLYRYRSPPPLATTHHPILYDIVMGRCSLRSANLCWDVLKFLIGAAIDRMMVGTLVGSDFPIFPPSPSRPDGTQFYGLSYAWYVVFCCYRCADGFCLWGRRMGWHGMGFMGHPNELAHWEFLRNCHFEWPEVYR